MSPKSTGLTDTQINRLSRQVEATEGMQIFQPGLNLQAHADEMTNGRLPTEVFGEDAPIAPEQITPEDELSKALRKELGMDQLIVDDLKTRKAKFTHDAFLVERLDIYRDALIKAHKAGSEIVFCIDILS